MVTIGGSERLRWKMTELPFLDLPGTSHIVATAMSPDGAVTGRSGSTLSTVGWHAFVWTNDEGMRPCMDHGWALSMGQAINRHHTVAGTVNLCPDDTGPCQSAPALMQTNTPAELLGPLLDRSSIISGISESGHVIFEQPEEDSWNYRGHVAMPAGDVIELPLPEGTWSVDLSPPFFMDGSDDTFFITGIAWTAPARQPMQWAVNMKTGDATGLVLPNTEGGEAHTMLSDGTILGRRTHSGITVPTQWSPPWTTYMDLAAPQSGMLWDAALFGDQDGRRVGRVYVDSRDAAWHLNTDGVLSILDANQLGLPPSDIVPKAMLPDGSILINAIDSMFYTSTLGTWREDTGFLPLVDRALNADFLNELGTYDLITGAQDGSCVINRYPYAWSAAAIQAGDVDGNGTVSVDDLLQLIAIWGPCDPSCFEDLNGDGLIGTDDLLAVLSTL